MFINKKRVQNIDKYLTGFNANEKAIVVLTDIEHFKDKLIAVGFSAALAEGEQVLPCVFGSISDYNANGSYEVLRDLPKERFSITQTREIKDWHGDYHTVFPSIEYQKFQRKFIEAPSVELAIVKDSNGNKIIVSPQIRVAPQNTNLIKHTANLFLELFGECSIVGDDFLSRVRTKITRVNWNILPQGIMPWDKIRKSLSELLDKTSVESKEDALNRFEYINSFSPDFVATGNGGFNDYVVFGFKDKNLYVLENSFAGNATYIFRNNWESISKLTKAEILKENLQEYRLIHKYNWKNSVKKILE